MTDMRARFLDHLAIRERAVAHATRETIDAYRPIAERALAVVGASMDDVPRRLHPLAIVLAVTAATAGYDDFLAAKIIACEMATLVQVAREYEGR